VPRSALTLAAYVHSTERPPNVLSNDTINQVGVGCGITVEYRPRYGGVSG
jgi:hypothetical protein